MNAQTPQVLDLQPWQDGLSTALPIQAQIVLTGNIRDVYPVQDGTAQAFVSLQQVVWHWARTEGFDALLRFDPVNGLQVLNATSPDVRGKLETAGLTGDHVGRDLEAAARSVLMFGDLRIVLMIDYASHLMFDSDQARDHFLIQIDQLARAAPPRADLDQPGRNPIVWIADRPGDLPDWFAIANPTLRSIAIDLPDLEERHAFAQGEAQKFHEFPGHDSTAGKDGVQTFALQTEGMTLTEMSAICDLARRQGFPIQRSDDAVRNFRTGIRRNPWTSQVMQDRLKNGRRMLDARIKGQERALDRTMDILVRSVMGLSGAQTSSRLNRPRGVLFFAGPTGVGKTELAKAVTELLFGDETLMHRFDMTEFNSERSIARMIGAPPGYAGHDAGGELTNAMRARPFSVVLFDEVEKAHPRILDMFLQILDEGRLTDARGETSYFSEAVIIFTSNVGMFGKDQSTNMGMDLLPSDSFENLEAKLLKGVREHFRFELHRPELMNRIGQNIVVFDFIHVRSAQLIFNAIVNRVLKAVKIEHGINVILTEEGRAQLSDFCISDLFDGGRGIGNRIETNLINPLAQALFVLRPEKTLTIEAFERDGADVRLLCR